VRFSPQSGENALAIKVVGQILIPPFGGSNPPAPAKHFEFWRILFFWREKAAKRDFLEPEAFSDIPSCCR
jgi:hypothetical protein